MPDKILSIPKEFPQDRLAAARLYHSHLDWAIHALFGPKERVDSPGKQPVKQKGWRKWTAKQVTDEYLQEHFGNGKVRNVGCVVRDPHVVIDLDSKPDKGASVREWLDKHPELQSAPRERTGGGAHLHFICPDLPVFRNPQGKLHNNPLAVQLNEKVGAELFFDGLNIVLAPSKHPNGHTYYWEVKGEIPSVTWNQLQIWFGFEDPADKKEQSKRKPGRPAKEEANWWEFYGGNLKTLRLDDLFDELGLLGKLLDADEGKQSVKCPWHREHSDGGKGWRPNQTGTVIWNETDGFPAFRCLHAHCEGRELKEVLKFAVSRGLDVDSFCERQRVWVEGQVSEDGRPRIVLPDSGKPDSRFAVEVGEQIEGKEVWFNHNHRTVIIRSVETTEELTTVGFHALKPIEAGTDLEQYVETGSLQPDNFGNWVFTAKSLCREGADKLLHAPQLLSRLPKILRILDSPLPVRHKEEICQPQPNYNPLLKAYLLPSAPQIKLVPIEEARQLIKEMLEGFCFESEQAAVHTVARLLTPFCRGLMGWYARPPLWVYEANRERCGKDYLNGVIQTVHDGNIVSNPPFNSDEELRKKITAALRSGMRRMHFANMKGHISSGALEEAVTNKNWSDRTLGHSEEKSYANEIEFSLSCNVGTTWTPDLGNRMRIISLFLAQEDPNEREFRHPDLHGLVRRTRGDILSALWAFVRYWDKAGRPDGTNLFASFPEWAKVVGGIMCACELGDPCLPDQRMTKVGGDEMTGDMKDLFALAHEKFGEEWTDKQEIYQLLEDRPDLGLFSWFDLTDKSGKTRFGKALHRYDKRILGDVVLAVEGDKNRRRYRFFRTEDAQGQPLAALSFLGEGGTSGTSLVVNPADSDKTTAETAAQPRITPPKEEHEEHEELIPPCETGRKINYAGLEERDSTINYLCPQKEDGEYVPYVPYVPFEEDNRLITQKSELGKIAKTIAKAASPVALDIETYTEGKGGALNPFKPGHIRLLTLSIPEHDPWLIDLRAVGDDLGELGPVLGQSEIIAHNAKFDLQWLRQRCDLNVSKVFCTMTASKLLTTGDYEAKNNLKTCLSRWLDLDLPKDQGKSDWGSMMLMPEQLEYAANDVGHLHALKKKQLNAIAEAGLKEVCELEMQLLPVVVDIEARGFAVNREILENIGEECHQRSLPLEAQLHKLFGSPINLESPKQLKEAFKEIGVNIPNTSAATMADTDHEAARLLLKYREVIKQRQQVETLLKATGPDNRIHGRFDPTATDTGRFSSREPNMQNISRGEIRGAFIAAPECQLVIADYSQIELRAAAVIAKDETMLAAYQSGEDIHTRTAASILGKPIKKVTKQDRQLAKAVNFGLLYGQAPRGLVRYAKSGFEVDLTYQEAVNLHEKFFATYQGLKKWHEEARAKAGSTVNEVRTLFGRRKLLPPHNEETFWSRFSAGFLNMIVQGTCADGLKQAMVQLADKLPDQAQMVGTVHDELIVECPADSAEEVCQLTEETMKEAMAEILRGKVPVEVEAKVCECWEEK